jgi:hypothetical protein
MELHFLGAVWQIDAPTELIGLLEKLLNVENAIPAPPIRIQVKWNPRLPQELPLLPSLGYWKKKEGNIRYHWGQGIYYKIGSNFVEFYWDFPTIIENYPLIIPFSYWAKDNGYRIIHAATAGYQGKWILMPAKSNAGKSTTVAACTQHQMEVAGDDIAFLEYKENTWMANTIYNFISLRPEAMQQFKDSLTELGDSWFERPDGKQVLTLAKVNRSTLNPIHAIGIFDLHPQANYQKMENMDVENVLSHFITSHYISSTLGDVDMKLLHTIKQLQRTLPFYSIQFSTNLKENVQHLKNLLQAL